MEIIVRQLTAPQGVVNGIGRNGGDATNKSKMEIIVIHPAQ